MSAVTIGSNIASLNAQRQLGKVSSDVSNIFERLSSGLRINKASDDAAGLAVATGLNLNSRVFTQGVRNLNDGTSLLNIADGAVSQLSNIMVRLKELAEQSANGTYGLAQRKALDTEAQALSKEYSRIIQTTKFNGQAVLSGNFGQLRLQAGFGVAGGIQSGLGGAVGTGSFGDSTSYSTGTTGSTKAVALGDLNGDGVLDMVTVGGPQNGDYVTVRLGNGNGTFGSSISFLDGNNNTDALALADLNDDGILDLVTTGITSGSSVGEATVRLGKGDGSFGNPASYQTTAGPGESFAVSLGDLNGDGILDLVTAGSYGATVQFGTGSGTFGTVTSYTMDGGPSFAVSLADLNNDGILDLVTAGQAADNQGSVSVRLGSGNGTFGSLASYEYQTGGESLHSLAIGDLNGDGVLDLVTASGYSNWNVQLGNGDGSLGSVSSYTSTIPTIGSVSLGDLNGDGILDLVTAGVNTSIGAATIQLGTGKGGFGSSTTLAPDFLGYHATALGDLNNDGVLDLVMAGDAYANGGAADVQLSQTTSGVSPLLPFKLTSRAGALQALSQFTNALNNISSQRGVIGAFESRINTAVNVLQVTTENFQAAASRITDADVASESANLTRTQILQQAASAVLAQANQQPALALRLLS